MRQAMVSIRSAKQHRHLSCARCRVRRWPNHDKVTTVDPARRYCDHWPWQVRHRAWCRVAEGSVTTAPERLPLQDVPPDQSTCHRDRETDSVASRWLLCNCRIGLPGISFWWKHVNIWHVFCWYGMLHGDVRKQLFAECVTHPKQCGGKLMGPAANAFFNNRPDEGKRPVYLNGM